ncbi:unnamed protein product, partial [Brassica rapa subsp. trilocularis]
MEPGGCSQGESRPEGVESDRRERWAQSGWVKVTAGFLMEPGGCSQGESRPEGVESDRR